MTSFCIIGQNDVENFWALEAIGIKENPVEKDDDTAIRLFEPSICQKPNGTYTVLYLGENLDRQLTQIGIWPIAAFKPTSNA